MSLEPALCWAQVPAGVVTLRDARTRTVRDASLTSFEISRVPVTAAQWDAVSMAGTGWEGLPVGSVTWDAAIDWCVNASLADGRAPAYRREDGLVHWDASADGYRLPTEAEWEHACRARSEGPTYGPVEDVSWCSLDNVDGPQPVANKAPNAWGLHDTLGNVWEWCWDYADTARYADYRTLKGGGWADPPWSCRVGVRRASAPDAVIEDVGFRVVRGGVEPQADGVVQGWSADADRTRAAMRGPLPMGWTPHRQLLR